ncbi:hypothetical protein QJQ45_021669, partial [Haematococcus lacustris]
MEKAGVGQQLLMNMKLLQRSRTTKLTDKQMEGERVAKKFCASLALYDLINEVPMQAVLDKFGMKRTTLVNLQDRASKTAAMVAAFCGQLGWCDLEMLVAKFQGRINSGVREEIVALTEIPGVRGYRARLLYKAGLRTPEAVAACELSRLTDILAAGMAASSKGKTEDQGRAGERRAARMILNGARELLSMKAKDLRAQASAVLAAMQQGEGAAGALPSQQLSASRQRLLLPRAPNSSRSLKATKTPASASGPPHSSPAATAGQHKAELTPGGVVPPQAWPVPGNPSPHSSAAPSLALGPPQVHGADTMLLLPATAEPQPHGPCQQPAQLQPPLAQPVQVASAQRPHNSVTGTQPPAWSHLPQHTPALQHQQPPPSAAVGPFPGGVAPAPLEEPLAPPPEHGLRFAAQQVGGAGAVGAAQPLLTWSAQPSGQYPSHAPQHQAWQSSAEMGMNCNGKRPMAVGTDSWGAKKPAGEQQLQSPPTFTFHHVPQQPAVQPQALEQRKQQEQHAWSGLAGHAQSNAVKPAGVHQSHSLGQQLAAHGLHASIGTSQDGGMQTRAPAPATGCMGAE